MSKFIERLKQLSEGAPEPIGFRPRGAAAERPKIQLVALVADAATGEQAAGADAVVLDGGGGTPKTDVPWGVRLGSAAPSAGCDFVVFGTDAALSAVPKNELGKIVAVAPDASDGAVRALNGMALDAVVVTSSASGESLTWQDLIAIHRVAAMLSKPVLAEVPAAITGPEIEQVWQAGAAGIVVRVTAGKAGRLQDLRVAISALTPPVPPRTSRPAARAPMAPAPRPDVEEDEEDEGD